jgi:hypothetical protein
MDMQAIEVPTAHRPARSTRGACVDVAADEDEARMEQTVMANENTTQCPICTRCIAIIGQGPRARLAKRVVREGRA